jgi:hypothetical protein
MVVGQDLSSQLLLVYSLQGNPDRGWETLWSLSWRPVLIPARICLKVPPSLVPLSTILSAEPRVVVFFRGARRLCSDFQLYPIRM